MPEVRRFLIISGIVLAALFPALPALAIDGSSHPTGFVTLVSDPDDQVGFGDTLLMTTPADDIELLGSATTQIQVYVAGKLNILLGPEVGSWQVGSYKSGDASGSTRGSLGINVSDGGRGCGQPTGSMQILQLGENGSGTITGIDLLYEQHCLGSTAAVFGEVRLGLPAPSGHLVAPTTVRWPPVAPGGTSTAVPVTVRNTGSSALAVGTPSLSGAGASDDTITADTCPASLTAGSSCQVLVRTTPGTTPANAVLSVPVGGTTETVQLLEVEATGTTQWRTESDPDDPLGQGSSHSYSAADSTFWVTGDAHALQVTLDHGSDARQFARFAPEKPSTLTPDTTFAGAVIDHNEPGTDPLMSVEADTCSNLQGTFTLQDYELDSAGQVTSFSLTFVEHCDGHSGATRGTIAYQAPEALDIPAAGSDVGVSSGNGTGQGTAFVASPDPRHPDGIPTGPVTGAFSTPVDSNAQLRWNNPGDADYDLTEIYASEGAPPTNGEYGVLLGQTNGFAQLVQLDPGNDYTFTLVPYDIHGNAGPADSFRMRGSDSTLTTSTTSSRAGARITLTGTVLHSDDASPVDQAAVLLYGRPAGSHTWTLVGVGLTGANGTVTFPVSPSISAEYLLRFLGDIDLSGSQAASPAVHVAPVLSLSATAHGRTATLTVQSHPVVPGLALTLQRQVRGSWVSQSHAKADSAGRAMFTVTSSGVQTYRVVSFGTSAHAAGTSNSKAVRFT